MKAFRLAAGTLMGLIFAVPARADIQPAELVASTISMTGSFVVANIYCGGTYGQTYPGGRTATLQVKEGAGAYRVLWSGKLPNIGPRGHYITAPYASPVKVLTTFRLSIGGTDRNPTNDVATAVFRPTISLSDRIQLNPYLLRSDAYKKLKIVPK